MTTPIPKTATPTANPAALYLANLSEGSQGMRQPLDVDDFDPEDCSVLVRGKRRKERTVYLTEGGCRYVGAWLRVRGDAPGPLFCPIRQTGEIRITRMHGESISYILRRRQEEAGTGSFSPHDLRRATITHLLDAGVDVFTVQKLAGHADATTTARYDRRGEGAKRRAVQSLEIPRRAA